MDADVRNGVVLDVNFDGGIHPNGVARTEFLVDCAVYLGKRHSEIVIFEEQSSSGVRAFEIYAVITPLLAVLDGLKLEISG